jgi:multidrug efflux pump subunit AcrA (membrane-fusion protein)
VLSRVFVEQGDRVTAGQPVAQIDPAMLDLGVESAQAAARRARADVGVIEGNLDTVADKKSQLATARTKLSDGEAQLTKARRQLVSARKQLVAARAKAVAGRAAIKKQIAALEKLLSGPPPPTPPTPPPGPTPAQLLALLKSKLAQLDAGIAQIDAGLAKVDAGLAKVNAGFGTLASARSKVNTGASALRDAKTQLRKAKDVLGIVAEGREAGVAYAKAARDAATLTAPVDGVVTYARLPGTVAIVGAPIVRIAPDGPQLVDTYLTGEQLAQVRMGAPARVALDSFPGKTFSARISAIGAGYEFVPTSFPTDIVHMTRATRVTLTLEEGTALPAGTPVDLTIKTRTTR